ncbi:hypothetical protein P167DRAFT_533997 [Morchella conica CCBAS932]|uniref:Uncharacterized protein n=1 Tax=Morchella conica CCBAS932 TaxID=1392247 RepID=A0A3N4L987_9PEZI|nr:hypothetical protein P167DRAFT_533997 [Morchella conica CCBAS932]
MYILSSTISATHAIYATINSTRAPGPRQRSRHRRALNPAHNWPTTHTPSIHTHSLTLTLTLITLTHSLLSPLLSSPR